MQVAVVPVSLKGRTIGAFVSGVLIGASDQFAKAAYENFNVAAATFRTLGPESRVISAAGEKNIFSAGSDLPDNVTVQISSGRNFAGKAAINGNELYMGAEPFIDSGGRAVGGIAVGVFGPEIYQNKASVQHNILLFTGVGIMISLILAGLTYRDTIRPIKAIISAMNDSAAGDLDVRTEIRTKDDFELIGDGFNDMVKAIQTRDKKLRDFNDLTKSLITTLDPEEIISIALERLMELSRSTAGAAYLAGWNDLELSQVTAKGMDASEPGQIGGPYAMAECLGAKKTVKCKYSGNGTEKNFAFLPTICNGRLNGVIAIGRESEFAPDELEHVEHLLGYISMGLENALAHKEIEKNSLLDPLTGLFNRRYLFERLGAEFSGAKRQGYCITVMMIDIDNFKDINDRFGHQQGDYVLQEVSRRLRCKTRATDVWGRYGGEEFIGFFSHCGMEGSYNLAEKIRKKVEETPFAGMDGQRVTVSIGVAHYPDEDHSGIEEMICSADGKLYKAKNSGKNKVVI